MIWATLIDLEELNPILIMCRCFLWTIPFYYGVWEHENLCWILFFFNYEKSLITCIFITSTLKNFYFIWQWSFNHSFKVNMKSFLLRKGYNKKKIKKSHRWVINNSGNLPSKGLVRYPKDQRKYFLEEKNICFWRIKGHFLIFF
jgi:hypothetical protein